MDQTKPRSPDVYGRTDELDARSLDAIADRLEARGEHRFFRGAIDEYMSELALAGPESILDLGCGTGASTRAIARRAEVRGPVTGIDLSQALIDRARLRAEQTGLGGRIGFRAGDAHELSLPPSSFDVVVMHTLLSHVANPGAVIAEGKRLLRPGRGRLVIFDGDYNSLTFATDAPDAGAATDLAIQMAVAAQPRVMRTMPRLLAEAGLRLTWSRGWLVADIGRPDFFAPSIPSYRILLPKAGALSEAEAADFAEALERAAEQDRFFAAANFYAFIAQID
jgi:ubiquinone/menaquinone biosynthesis C-methylase UbiE